jgi:hypothetical protein
MNARQYLEKIFNLSNQEKQPEYFDNVVLENLVSKVLSKAGNSFALTNLFKKSVNDSISINNEILILFSNSTGLLLWNEKEVGNVCFANNNEVRSEFKQSFSLIDLFDYIYAFTHSSNYRETFKIIIPTENDIFWEVVKMGSNLRKEEIK